MSAHSHPGPSRRAVLAGALVTVAAAGCRSSGDRPDVTSADDAVKQRVLASKQDLLDRYAATAERHPRLRNRLVPLMADHQAHVEALRATSAPPSPAGPSAPPGTPPTPAEVPSGRAAALAALATAETAASDTRVRELAGCSPTLARVLASVGGCEAGHAELLRGPA
jgi:hypothetical protein